MSLPSEANNSRPLMTGSSTSSSLLDAFSIRIFRMHILIVHQNGVCAVDFLLCYTYFNETVLHEREVDAVGQLVGPVVALDLDHSRVSFCLFLVLFCCFVISLKTRDRHERKEFACKITNLKSRTHAIANG